MEFTIAKNPGIWALPPAVRDPRACGGNFVPQQSWLPCGLRREREGMPSLSPLRGPSHLPAPAASRLPSLVVGCVCAQAHPQV
jgi:hypothetical protein